MDGLVNLLLVWFAARSRTSILCKVANDYLFRIVVFVVRYVHRAIGASERVHYHRTVQTTCNFNNSTPMLGDALQQRATCLFDVALVARLARDLLDGVLYSF